jgi:hypothetical protein
MVNQHQDLIAQSSASQPNPNQNENDDPDESQVDSNHPDNLDNHQEEEPLDKDIENFSLMSEKHKIARQTFIRRKTAEYEDYKLQDDLLWDDYKESFQG